MTTLSLGDLAQTFMLQRQGVTLRTEMARLNAELTSGQVEDVKSVLAGNYSYLSDIERDLKTNEGYTIAATEARQFTDAVQLTLERVQTSSEGLGAGLLSITSSPSLPLLSQSAQQARGALETMFSALNSDVAGRSLFAGTTTDAPALADADVLLTALTTAVSGALSSDDIRTAAQAWFDDPAGFDAVIYTGSNTGLSPFTITREESVDVDVRANNQVFKDILMNTALAALSDRASLSLDVATQTDLQKTAGIALLGGQQDITGLRGTIGNAQARIDALTTRLNSEKTSLEFARSELLAVDPFETATRLEDVQFRLQSLYTVTARTADLSLVNFLR